MLQILRLGLLLSFFFVVYGSLDLCGKCKKEECMPPLACKAGSTKDTCGCCDVCLSTEGELCGGINSAFGVCSKGLTCVTRNPRSVRNKYLPPGFSVGRCEPEECRDVKCGMHQACSLVNGTATCVCSMNCGKKLEPVCGLADGKDYRNPCKVREKECKLQVLIGYSPGYCKVCARNGRDYKFGEKTFGSKKCEECTCRHGNWVCSLNLKCLREDVYEGYDCTGTSRSHAPIECPDGYRCNITKKGEDGYADRGVCQRLVPDDVCRMTNDSGPCFGYFVRWYFDSAAGECKQFVYGGCGGNHNRFKRKKGCEHLCQRGKIPEPLKAAVFSVHAVKKRIPRRVKVSGKIVAPKRLGKIPSKSCLMITVEDISRVDAPSVVMASQKRHISGFNPTTKPLRYAINFLPKNGSAKYDVNVVLNIGWCPRKGSQEWVRERDYLTTSAFEIPLNDKEDAYSMDIKLEYYAPVALPATSLPKTLQPVLPELPEPFPVDGGMPPPVEFSNETVTLSGVITLKRVNISNFPTPSCMLLQVQDISIMDASSLQLTEERKNISGLKITNSQIKYNFTMKKPLEKEFGRTFSISASISVGSCLYETKAEGRPRVADLFTDTNFHITFQKDSNEVKKDFHVIDNAPLPLPKTMPPVLPEVPEPPFPYDGGAPPPVEFSNDTVTITGFITLKKAVIKRFPIPSCLVIKVEDISRMDTSSLQVAQETGDISDLKTVNNKVEYQFTMKKPLAKEFKRTFSVDASISVGWCLYNGSRISRTKRGDFYTDTNFIIAFKKDSNAMRKNFHVVYNCNDEKCKYSEKEKARDPGTQILSAIKEKTCFFEKTSRNYPLGSEWETDDCLTCRCTPQGPNCSPKPCPTLNCRKTKIVKGKCCPVCDEKQNFCIDSRGIKRQFGERFRGSDDCERCSCHPGVGIMCAVAACADPVCTEGRPVKVPGICCRVCSNKNICSDSKDGEKYVEGRLWQRKDCSIAYCSASGVLLVHEKDVVRDCPGPASLERRCPKVCPRKTVAKIEESLKKKKGGEKPIQTCLDNNTKKRHSVGQLWHPVPCQICVCGSDLKIKCKTIKCKAQINCSKLVSLKGKCCPVCKSDDKPCVYEGKEYKAGQYVKQKCNNCLCGKSGHWACTLKLCHGPTLPEVPKPTKAPGCLYKGKTYKVGESTKQDCNTCMCGKTGYWACTLKMCVGPTLPKVTKPTEAPGCLYKGKTYKLGESTKQDCNTCMCGKAGNWACTRKMCLKPTVPEVSKPTKAPGQCKHKEKTYKEGETRQADDGCNTCFCGKGGAWGCTLKLCFGPTLPKPTTAPGQCKHKEKTYKEGETRKADDGCNTCFCGKGGAWGCTLKLCFGPTLPKPTTAPVQCKHMEVTYKEGDTRPSDDGCNTCTCAGGMWACTEMACLTTPATREEP